MIDKRWYIEERDGCKEREKLVLQNQKKFIQKIINLYCPELFTCPEDITPDNLKSFLEVILKNFASYNLDHGDIPDIGDIIYEYLHRVYTDEFPDNFFPTYPKNDRRQLAIRIFKQSMSAISWCILPEDVPFILECLSAPEDQIEFMYEKLDKYFDQFDHCKRWNEELPQRLKIITEQRIEALQKGEPLPIRPMGIELDMCYKTQEQKKEGINLSAIAERSSDS